MSGWFAAAALLLSTSLFPQPVNAQSLDMSVHISGRSGADKWIYLSGRSGADKWVYVAGKCRRRGDTWFYLSGRSGADEWWTVVDSPIAADMTICLSGDLEEWFENIR